MISQIKNRSKTKIAFNYKKQQLLEYGLNLAVKSITSQKVQQYTV